MYEEKQGMPEIMDPEKMPEIKRELTVLGGAILSVENRVDNLLERLSPLLNEGPHSIDEVPAEQNTKPPARTKLGHEISGLSDHLGKIEHNIERALYRLEI